MNHIKRIIKERFKMQEKPDISVIVPVFNTEKYIGDCLNSVLDQKGVKLEVILIDDGSTDGSNEIVKEYMKEYQNIKMYSSNHKGPGAARNLGVRHAKGEYIAFVDADDMLVQGIYRRMLRAVRENQAQVCICNSARFNEEKIWNSDLHDHVYKNYELCTHIMKNPTLVYDTTSWNKLIKRDFYTRNRIAFPEGVIYEDIIFNAKIHALCNKVIMLAETGYMWRTRSEREQASLSQTYYEKKNIQDRLKAAQDLIDYCSADGFPEELKRISKYKVLERDFKIALDSVNHINREDAMDLFATINDFINRNIDEDVLRSLPVVDIQRYKCVQEMDVDGYKKLLEYRKGPYNKAPVREQNGRLLADLPSNVIDIDNRDVTDEFARRNRRTWVDSIEKTEDDIIIKAHSYIHRYNMPNPDSQEIIVKLVNEEFGEIVIAPSAVEKTSFLTERFGEVFDEYSNTMTNYNYDYTGFSFSAREALQNVPLNYKKKKYSVIIEYKDRIFNGTQIIKGVDDYNVEHYEKKRLVLPDRRIRIKFGEQKELQIVVDRLESK